MPRSAAATDLGVVGPDRRGHGHGVDVADVGRVVADPRLHPHRPELVQHRGVGPVAPGDAVAGLGEQRRDAAHARTADRDDVDRRGAG